MAEKTKQIKTVSLLNKEWRNRKVAGTTVKAQLPDYYIDPETGDVEEITVEVEIRILGGSENTRMQDMILQKDEDGKYVQGPNGAFLPKDDPDGSLGETSLVAVSTGISVEDAAEIRRNKTQRFWNSLFMECNKYNGITLAEVEAEKNGEESAQPAGS